MIHLGSKFYILGPMCEKVPVSALTFYTPGIHITFFLFTVCPLSFWTQGLPGGVLSNRPYLSILLFLHPSVRP